MKYSFARFGGRCLGLLVICFFLSFWATEARAQGCARDVSYRIEKQGETSSIYLSIEETGETYTAVLYQTADGVKEINRESGIRLTVGKEKRIFQNVASGHYVIQLINEQGCHFVVNGMKGVTVE